MGIINSMMYWFMKRRVQQIELFITYPFDTQQSILTNLLYTASQTEYGKKYDFASSTNYEYFKQNVPLVNYEKYESYIERTRKGEENIIWPGKIKWFAKSSGTTNAKSKFIPITQESLNECHYKAGKDMFSLYLNNFPESQIFENKNLRLGGSSEMYKDFGSAFGDLSAILIDNLPFWAEMKNIPNRKTSLMSEWESKMRAIIDSVLTENVGSLTGVPSWMLVLLYKILEETQETHIHAIWPNLEVFFHGGISFKPYAKQYEKLFQKPINYYEIYNASEGFFGVQDQRDSKDLLLLLDHGVFYEFMPMEEYFSPHPTTIDLSKVEVGKNYAMVITTNGGLWRYIIGDTVKFTSTHPYRFQISGRTKHYINAFGEELIIENAEEALKKVQMLTQCEINEFTAGPVFMSENQKGSHEWIIEFRQFPENREQFIMLLDETLQSLNSDYEAKRYKNITLQLPKVHFVPNGFFHHWLREKGKLGGQNKVPRLANTREFLDPLLQRIV